MVMSHNVSNQKYDRGVVNKEGRRLAEAKSPKIVKTNLQKHMSPKNNRYTDRF
jgi:hypothetical protein